MWCVVDVCGVCGVCVVYVGGWIEVFIVMVCGRCGMWWMWNGGCGALWMCVVGVVDVECRNRNTIINLIN